MAARIARSPAAALTVALAALLALHLCGAFFGLARSSFWFDELWTAWFVQAAGPAELLRRTLIDVHLPFYYIVAWAWAQLFGVSEAGLRALSAAASVAALLLLVWQGRRHMSLTACLVAAVAAATSQYWVEHSQNARMYGVGMLLAVGTMLIALHALEDLRESRGLPGATLASLFGVGLIYAFTQVYMFIGLGGVYAGLLLAARNWRDRTRIALAGAATAVAIVAFLNLLRQRSDIDLQSAWFESSPGFLAYHTRFALSLALAWPVWIVLAAGVGCAAWIVRRWPPRQWPDRLAPLLLVLCPPAAILSVGILTSLLVLPSYSYRNAGVSTPFLWIALGLVLDLVLRDGPRIMRRALLALFCVALLAATPILRWRAIPQREDFRRAARVIDAIPACRGRPIPIIRKDPIIYGPTGLDAYRSLFGYYLSRPPSLLPLMAVDGTVGLIADPATRALVARRIAGQDLCPVVGLTVHPSNLDAPAVAAMLDRLAPGNPPVSDRPFPHLSLRSGRQETATWLFLADAEASSTVPSSSLAQAGGAAPSIR